MSQISTLIKAHPVVVAYLQVKHARGSRAGDVLARADLEESVELDILRQPVVQPGLVPEWLRCWLAYLEELSIARLGLELAAILDGGFE
jgi:hypothetical protein